MQNYISMKLKLVGTQVGHDRETETFQHAARGSRDLNHQTSDY